MKSVSGTRTFNYNKMSLAFRKSQGLRYVIASAALVGASAISMPSAIAQSTGVMSLEEIVVTARRREESLQDVPIAITAMDEDFLRNQSIVTLSDLSTNVPSLRVTQGTQNSSAIVNLRGQRPVEVLITLDPAVPIYLADVPLTPMMGTNLAMYDLQNVQVLKGPQGTLFGRNSTGGAVLVTPRTPGEEFGGYAEVKIGNYDLRHFEGAVDLPVSDALKFRLAGRKVDRDGYQSNVADNNLACDDCIWDEDSYGVRLSMEFTPSEQFRNLTLIARDENETVPRVGAIGAFNRTGGLPSLYESVHNGGLASLNPLLGLVGLPPVPDVTAIDDAVARQAARGLYDVEVNVDGKEKVENTFFINTTEFEINDNLRIKNIIGFRDMDFVGSQDSDGSPVPMFGSITADNFPENPSRNYTEGEQWSEEFQILGTAFDEKLEWIVGGFWLEMEGSELYNSSLVGSNPDWPDTDPSIVASALAPILGPAGAGGIAFLYGVAQNGFYSQSQNIEAVNTAKAIFAEGTYQVNEQWSVTAGVRQTWDTREMTTFKTDVYGTTCVVLGEGDVPLPLESCERHVEEDYSEPTWRIAASYSPAEDQLIYGSVSTGYRAGGFNSRGVDDFSLQPYDQETVLNFELGYKADWDLNGVALRANIALFTQSYEDIQKTQGFTDPDTNQYATTIINAAEATIEGGEIELTIIPTDNLSLSLNYSLVQASYDDWVLETYLGQDVSGNPIVDLYDNSGADFTYIPETSASGQLVYTLPVADEFGDMTFVASFYYQDEMTSNEEYARWPDAGWTEGDLERALSFAKLDGYTVVDVRLDWRNVMGSNFDVAIFSKNVNDEEYQSNGTTVPEQLGLISTRPGEPRTIGASLRYNF